jgi:hypothetical protein
MAVSFGVVSGASNSYGTVNSAEKETTAEIANCRNAAGVITNEQAYSRTTTARNTAVLTGSAPAAGTSLTIYGVAGLATRIREIESNTGYAMVESETTKGDSATQVALA